MYNPDFWEVRLEPHDLAQYPNESGIWFDDIIEEEPNRHTLNRPLHALVNPIISTSRKTGIGVDKRTCP